MSRYPIIIEGPDGGGKTHLAKRVVESYPDRKYTRPPDELLSSADGPTGDLAQWWDNELRGSDQYLAHRVYDRCFYISDAIYQQAQVERELMVTSIAYARGISKLWNVEPIIIFCLPPFDVQLANVRQSGRDRLKGVTDAQLEKISNMYWATQALWSNALYEQIRVFDYTRDEAYAELTNALDSVVVTKI